MKCELCNIEHNGVYGSGRFCSQYCARKFSSFAKRKEINEKVSQKLHGWNYKTNSPSKAFHIKKCEGC